MITLKEAIELTDYFHKNNRPDYEMSGYLEHVIMVGACASIIASACGLDVKKIGVMGYCHDIGKIIVDERKNKTFHGLTGYEYFKSVGEDELAQICLTHSFNDQDFTADEYKSYGVENINKTKEIINTMTITDYDRIIQMSDTFINYNGINSIYDSIKNRMKYIEDYYKVEHIYIKKKYKKALKLKRYLEQKYNIDIYKLLGLK